MSRRIAALGVLLCALLAPTVAAAKEPGATIRYTSFGIPHIIADDIEGLGYGFGYAHAQDNICTLADTYTTVRAQRSKFFGPDKSWTFRGNGAVVNNRNSDFFYQHINDSKIVERLVDEAPPTGPKPEIKDGVRGYVAGYNQRLREWGGADGVPDERCRGKAWVTPIAAIDVYRRFYQLASLASQGVAIDGIAGAAPLVSVELSGQQQRAAALELGRRLQLPIGSNAYGFGKDVTDNGRGMVLGNPHFPWDGSERLWQSQLTIPGKIDVEGGSLLGVPLINIGHTRGLAWSHTVATAYRFTPVQLQLVPGSPTSYVVDGQVKQMQADKVTIGLGDGKTDTRTLYSTQYGPMFTSILGLPLFPWTPAVGYAMHDVNATNFRYLNHFYDTNQAQSVREYDAIQQRYQGIPWVNSIAADARGEAYYTMNGAIPNVPDSKVADCNVPGLGTVTNGLLGLPTLDGSRSACDWDNDPSAAAPGIFGSASIPSLFRNDFVHNANDSHWLTNPRQPLEGFARIIGDERTARSLRTRLGLKMVLDRQGKLSLADLRTITLENRQYAGELWRDALVAYCRANPTQTSSGGQSVDVSKACDVLAAWDLHDNLDSRGALLFRRFVERARAAPAGLPVNPGLTSPFATPFSVDDPVNTPSGLNTNDSAVQHALADAVLDLQGAGIPLDAPLRDFQYEVRGGKRIPIHGGPGVDGLFNAINVQWDPAKGYPNVPHGSSFVMAAQFTGAKSCPVRASTFVTYGQTEDQGSPHASDFTQAFSQKRWVDERFCQADIVRDPEFSLVDLGARCTPRVAFHAVRVRRGGAAGRIVFSARRKAGGVGPLTVDARRAEGGALLKRLAGARRTLTWHRRVRDGDYVARFAARGPSGLEEERVLTFTVRRGRVVSSAPASRAPSCGLLREFSVRPVFGAHAGGALAAAFRLGAPARVSLELRRGSRVVKRTAFRRFAAGEVQSLELSPSGLRAGRYRARIVVRDGTTVVRATLGTRLVG